MSEDMDNTADETKESPHDKWTRELRQETIQTCKNLYSGYCHCWECGDGWTRPLSNLSYALETLNITLGKRHGYRIVADQVKEKFGTLRFYYSVQRIVPAWTQVLSFPFRFLSGLIRKRTNFKLSYEKGSWGAPTRMVPLYRIMTVLARIGRFLDMSGLVPERDESVVVRRYMDETAERLIEFADRECYGLCEVCGDQIGTSWKARCETKGWIRYVCEDCAKKHRWQYSVLEGGPQEENVAEGGEADAKEDSQEIGK